MNANHKLVVSDTSPLRYLVLIDAAEVLPTLYGRVLIPETVSRELQHPNTPALVRQWLAALPPWLTIRSVTSVREYHVSESLDPGELDAIRLALELQADLLLADDREAVAEARRNGLAVTATLGVLDQASQKSLLSLPDAIARLKQTNFRANPTLLQRLLAEDARRRT